jgi:hypothetical protein
METFQLLTKAYGEDGRSNARVFEWHKWFSESKIFPKLLPDEQKQRCKELFFDLLQRIENEPDLNLIITCDET